MGTDDLDRSNSEQSEQDESMDQLTFFWKKRTDAFDIPLQAYYIDGCGEYAPLIIDMMTVAFQVTPCSRPHTEDTNIGSRVYDGNQPSTLLHPLVPSIAIDSVFLAVL